MQIRGLHRNIYKAANYALSIEINDKQAEQRRKVLGDWDLLKAKGLSDKEISQITGMSRATYYRRKKRLKEYGLPGLINFSKRPKKVRMSSIPKEVHGLILKVRQENPTYGKEKIKRILERDFDINYSVSTVGRILKCLMETGRIKKYRAATRPRRKRKFDKHAQRWKYGMKAKSMGEMIQIDHMSVNKNGVNVKHFQAWDPISKTIVTEAYTCASSSSAAKFFDKVIQEMPFAVKSIQVDGGSEFMKHFEDKCQENKIPIYVLPPKRPQWNGGVERGNRTFRDDLYRNDAFIPGNLSEVRQQLREAQNKYNTYRPHQALGGLTPMEYVMQKSEVKSVSYVMN